MIRHLDVYDYGVYALAFVIAIFGSSVSNSLVSTPLSVYTPGLASRTRRLFLETLLSTANFILIASVILLGLILSGFVDVTLAVAMSFTGFVASYTARQFSRTFCYARLRPSVALYGDISYVTLSLLLLLLIFTIEHSISVVTVLAALAIGNIVAIAIELTILKAGKRMVFRARTLRHYLKIWKDVRWALAGVACTTLQTQAHSLLIAISIGPSAFAPLAAGNVLFGPVRIALQAWQNVMRPELAVAIARSDRQAVVRIGYVSIAFMIVAVMTIGMIIMLLWEPIYQTLYAAKYAESPMGWIVFGWCVITFFTSITVVPSGILQAFREFKILAIATFYGSLISVSSVACALLLFSPEMSLLGILLAEIFVAAFLLKVVVRRVRMQW